MTTAAIITSSDGVAAGTRDDASGDALEAMLAEAGFDVERHVVPDELDQLSETMRRLAHRVRLIVVTGGTGFGPRDVTPEATRQVIDRVAPGLGEAMRAAGRAITPMADLSRAVCGSVGRCLVLNVPGSPKGATESLEAVLGLVPHVLDLLEGDTEHADGAPEPDTDVDGVGDHDDAHGDPACDLAHGVGEVGDRSWRLVCLIASPVALQLHHLARLCGWTTVLVEPDADRVTDQHRAHADLVVTSLDAAGVDTDTDVVATNHDTDHLHDLLDATLRTDARWIGLMGSKRHAPPHIEELRDAGWDEDAIARIHRPIGLDIGSHTPAEIAISTIAALLADRNDRHGSY